jgi:hypothetical protein
MATGIRIGWIAIGVGFLCGFAVRVGGKGQGTPFRIVGAACALAGCFLGALWAFDHEVTKELGKNELGLQIGLLDEAKLLIENLGVMTWVIFAIAVWEGWKFSVDDG